MKRKLILLCVFILSLIALLGITAFAEENEEDVVEITILYYSGPRSIKGEDSGVADVDTDGDGIKDGYRVTLRATPFDNASTDGKVFFWYTDEGKVYDPAVTQTVVFKKDTKLYQFIGEEQDTITAANQWGTKCIRLTKDLTLTDRMPLCDGGYLILDLNGHNITSSSKDFVSQQRAGLVIINSKSTGGVITHTGSGVFFNAKYHFYGGNQQLLWIGKDVTINTPNCLLNLENDHTAYVGIPNVRICGNTNSRVLVVARGTSDATVDIYDGANITVTGTSLYEDIGIYDDRVLVRFTIHGGNINVPTGEGNFLGFIKGYQEKIHDFEILGGTYNIDIQRLISTDYRCIPNSNGTFSIVENNCPSAAAPDGKHDYIIESLTVTCEEDGVINYECLYCGDYYSVERNALEHTFVSVQTTQPVSNATETIPGVREQYCSRCTRTTKEYFYLDPAETYVSVKVRQNGITETLRVKGKVLFSFTQHGKLEGKTKLASYAVSRFDYTYSTGITKTFKKEEIIGVEIPLGTTCIAGGIYEYTDTPLGAFYNQDVIEEVILPMSLLEIESHAFRNMDKLESVKMYEFDSESGKMVECSPLKSVTMSIGDSAFEQDELSRLSFDYLDINAEYIGSNAFRNCPVTAVKFGKDVHTIKAKAFVCDGNLAFFDDTELKEIFFESFTPQKYPNMDGYTVETVNAHSALLHYNVDGDPPAIDDEAISKGKVYYDHTYDVVVHAPTCIELGYTGYECIRCGYGTKSNFVSNQGITHEWEFDADETVASTCSTQGFTAEICHKCGSKRASEFLPLDPNNHTFTLKAPEANACSKRFWKYVRVCECGVREDNSYLAGVTKEPLNADHVSRTSDFFDVTEQVKVSCGSDGYTKYKCKYCSFSYEETFTATGKHTIAIDEANTISPTCHKTGTNAFYCSNEGCTYTKTEVVPKLKGDAAKPFHVYTDWVVLQEPTYEITGFRQRVCTLCGTQETEILNTLVKESFWDKLSKTWDSKLWLRIVVISAIVVVVAGIIAAVIYFVLFRKAGLGRNFKYGFEKTADEKMSKKEQRMWKKKIKKAKKQK